MAFIANAIKSFFGNLLLEPIGYRQCDTGWDFGKTGISIGYCFPLLSAHPRLRVAYLKGDLQLINKDAPPEEQAWLRRYQYADTYGVASAANCAPNTIPWNGSCLNDCIDGYKSRTIRSRDKKTGKPIWEFECVAVATSNNHDYNWRNLKDGDGNEIPSSLNALFETLNTTNGVIPKNIKFLGNFNITDYAQPTQGGFSDLWTFHKPTNGREKFAGDYTSVPLTIHSVSAIAGNKIGDGGNYIIPPENGLWGRKNTLFLGKPDVAGSCPPPNVLTSTGQCLRPTPPEMVVLDNMWFTKVTCPTDLSVEIDGGKQCKPIAVERKKYPSLLDLILIIIAVILGVYVIVKVISAIRTSRK